MSKLLAVVIFSIASFSFTAKPGGEGFEIYLNNKMMIQQYGENMNTVQSLRFDQNPLSDQITIKYHHCGKIGKNRVITIKDGQNNVLKVFRYTDATQPLSAMSVNVKEIRNLKKETSNSFKLYYSSSELTAGRLLFNFSI